MNVRAPSWERLKTESMELVPLGSTFERNLTGKGDVEMHLKAFERLSFRRKWTKWTQCVSRRGRDKELDSDREAAREYRAASAMPEGHAEEAGRVGGQR